MCYVYQNPPGDCLWNRELTTGRRGFGHQTDGDRWYDLYMKFGDNDRDRGLYYPGILRINIIHGGKCQPQSLLPPPVKARACYCTVAWTWSKIYGPGKASFGTYIQHPIDWGDKFLTPKFWRRSQEGFWSCGFVWNLWDPFKFDGWENTLSLLKLASITI
jgi:hypothetical protein